MPEHLEVKIGTRTIDVSNPSKLMYPDDGITKADVVDYYRRIAVHMVRHLRGRPLMMARYPDGISKSGFYQKDIPDYFPSWIHRVTVGKSGGSVTHVVCDDAATLVYLAVQACLTPHVWLSRADEIEHPDRVVFDLDPGGDDFAPVRDAARLLRKILRSLELVPYLQTTGSRGLHVVVPLDPSAPFDEVRAFAHEVATCVAAADPARLTVEQRKARRGGRVYIDVMRNGYAQTVVAPYALRPLGGAPVATPIDWRELDDSRLGPQRYRMKTIFRRLGRRTDPWARIDRDARALEPARRRLAALRSDAGTS
jgi:bifunctional non-homologous end joining protein LigD